MIDESPPRITRRPWTIAGYPLVLLLGLALAAGCGGQSDAQKRVDRCVAHNPGDATLAEFTREVVTSGCRNLEQESKLPADGRVDVYAACTAPPEVPCVPAPGMTSSEVKRALAGADASDLRPVSLVGRVEGYGLALTTGIAATRHDITLPRDGSPPPPRGPWDSVAQEHLSTFDSNEGFSHGGGFGLSPATICDAQLAFGGPKGKKRARKLQEQFAAALDEACRGGSIELEVAADVLRQQGVTIRAVLVGDVRPDNRSEAGPSIEIKVQASKRRAQSLVAQWAIWNATAPRNAPDYGRAESSGRLFTYSIVDKRGREAADKALDGALAAMSK